LRWRRRCSAVSCSVGSSRASRRRRSATSSTLSAGSVDIYTDGHCRRSQRPRASRRRRSATSFTLPSARSAARPCASLTTVARTTERKARSGGWRRQGVDGGCSDRLGGFEISRREDGLRSGGILRVDGSIVRTLLFAGPSLHDKLKARLGAVAKTLASILDGRDAPCRRNGNPDSRSSCAVAWHRIRADERTLSAAIAAPIRASGMVG
jgi:hypothetical protein